jgi:hypothetical protein
MKKVAFLFLIYDTINHEDIWYHYFRNVDPNKYTIYIHYKTNSPLKHFGKHKLSSCIETKYADVSLVNAQNLLLKEALKDEDNQHFVFISNSCIPFKKFDYVYDTLDATKSYFNIAPHSHCFPRCDSLLPILDRSNIQKASQWCILNRKHSSIIIQSQSFIDACNKVYAPDEICYITIIYMNGIQSEIITTPNVANDATTFTNWSDMGYKYSSTYGLKNYDRISVEELQHLLNSKCMFGRKFKQSCALNQPQYLHAISNT